MKGCFTNDVVCNQTECIDTATSEAPKFNFCCCKDDMCNAKQKWIRPITEAPGLEGRYSSHFSLNIIIYNLNFCCSSNAPSIEHKLCFNSYSLFCLYAIVWWCHITISYKTNTSI